MNLGRKISAQGCVWALIMLAVCQPVIHQACFCSCPEAIAVNKLPTATAKSCECSSGCCAKKSHKKHRASERPSVTQKLSKAQNVPRPIGPCECPRECPCQVQHQVAPASPPKTESPLSDFGNESLVAIGCNEFCVTRIYAIARVKETSIQSTATAAATCAALCRFLS